MSLRAYSLRSSVFLVPAPERQMPAPPPHTEAAAAPALTPGEQHVLDHRSSLWEAVPVAGAAALSSARLSPLISGTVLEESFCSPRCLSLVALMVSLRFTPQACRGTWVQDPASGLLPRASALVIDTSTLHLTLSLLLAPCPACHHMGVSSLCFPHLSHTPAVTHSCSQTGLKFVFCSRPILSKSLVDTAIGKT